MRRMKTVLLTLLTLCSSAAHAVILSFTPTDQTAAPGQTVQVSVGLSGLTNGVGSFAFSVNYEPTILAFTGVTDGGALGVPGIDTLGLASGVLEGSISLFDVSFLDPASLLAIQSDRLSLLTLNFSTLGAGVSPLTFRDVSLADVDALPIEANIAFGTVAVADPSEPSVPVPEPPTLLLFLAGIAGLLVTATKRRLLKRGCSGAAFSLLLLAAVHVQSASAAAACDVDADRDVDRNDLTLIQQAILKHATPSTGDARDANADGAIDATDARICSLRCTRQSCAANTRPVANAGADQNVVINTTIVLDGSASSDPDGDALTYRWTLLSAPANSVAQLDDVSLAKPRFVADKVGVYEFQLVVRDGAVESPADTVAITALNASPIAPSTVTLDSTLSLQVTSIPGFDGEPNRPVAALTDRSGILMHYVANEIIVVSNDTAAVTALANRWGGTLVRSFLPGNFGLPGTAQHLVRIPSGTVSTSQLIVDLQKATPDARSDLRVSSQAGLRVLAAAAHEKAAGNVVGLNIVMQPATYESRVTTEHATMPICPGNDDDPNCVLGGIAGTERFESNAFLWSYMRAGGPQDIGVGEAWRALSLAGKLGNQVKIAVIDGGFSLSHVDNPPDTFHNNNSIFEPNEYPPNQLTCTDGAACPWHGDNVVSALMGGADNHVGAAGPAGPIARAVEIRLSGDVFNYLSAWAIAFTSGARIINMSWGARVPAAATFALEPINLATILAHDAGLLLFAAAGNKSVNVDGEDCVPVIKTPCWEEAWWTPCENGGVICVGALADNADFRWYVSDELGSNYGDDEVDIFGPGRLWVADDQSNFEPHLFSATSAATPFVAGVAALIMAANPSLSGAEVEQILLQTAHPSSDTTVKRFVNAQGAVNQALGGSQVCLPPQLQGPGGGGPLISCRDYSFSTSHQSAFGPYRYSWRRFVNNNWIDLADSATVGGAKTDRLTFSPYRPKDAGQYDVIVSNICGTTLSNTISLSILDGAFAAPTPDMPAPREYHAMSFDRGRGRMVLHGGVDFVNTPVVVGNIRFNGITTVSDETWERNANGTWQVVTQNGPPTRYHHAMAYDEARGVTVLFGGFVCQSSAACVRQNPGNEQIYGDTWEWDGTSWTQKLPLVSPDARYDHTMTYDPVRRRVVLFAGRSGFGGTFNDMWEFDGTTWTRRVTSGDPALGGEQPVGRTNPGFVFDRVRGVYVMHGGIHFETTTQKQGDTWELNSLGGWSLKATAAAGSDLIFDSGMAYDDFGRTLLAANPPTRATLWEWNGTAWTQRGDLPLAGSSVAYDSAHKRTVFAGGGRSTFGFPQSDTKEWEYFDQSCNSLP